MKFLCGARTEDVAYHRTNCYPLWFCFESREESTMGKMFNPPHPGAMVAEELDSLGISAREFARHIGVAPSSITRILNEEGPITPVMAVKIAKALKGPDARIWLRMQADYDAWQAEKRVDVSSIAVLSKVKSLK